VARSRRSELRATVFEIADNRCEHPILTDANDRVRCRSYALEMSHIVPRGMGHTGYRDVLENVMAACTTHARSTDDLSSREWRGVPPPGDRIALAEWVAQLRTPEDAAAGRNRSPDPPC
jgi:hypothetical protein